MQAMTIEDVLKATGGTLLSGDIHQTFNDVISDSRKVTAGVLFVPLVGEKFDGHEFIKAAFDLGASAVLTQRDTELLVDKTIVKVEDTLKAFGDIAKYYKQKYNVPTVSVTGSVGQTTTKDMLASVLSQKYNTLKTMGNFNNEIGLPITIFGLEKEHEAAVLEMGMNHFGEIEHLADIGRPDVAVITNITPNHLNIHKDYNEYIEAKKNIFKYQNKDGILILNYDNEITRNCEKEAPGKVIFFSSKQKLDNGYIVDGNVIKECDDRLRKHIVDTEELTIKGKHNYENICASLAATKELVDESVAIEIIKKFPGVEHRIEFVREINGAKWYNDSASSTPTRTISGLNAFDKEEIILIAGGADKNLDYTPLAKPVLEKVKTLILMGETAGKIFEAVKQEQERENKELNIYMVDSLKQAVILAKRYSKPGQVVLFSPASTSFDMFKNMYERGNIFKKLVNRM